MDAIFGGAPQFELSVKEPWLFYIQIGEKKVEGRRGDPDKYSHWVGKEVVFFNKRRKFPVKVTHINHYVTLEDMIDKEGVSELLPGIPHKRAVKDVYHEFYTDESIKERGGMVAIHFVLV